MDMVQCTSCGELKQKTNEFFHKHRNGLNTVCKECKSISARKRSKPTRDKTKANRNVINVNRQIQQELNGFKECIRCKEIVNLCEFYHNKKSWDKLGTYCKSCTRTYSNEYSRMRNNNYSEIEKKNKRDKARAYRLLQKTENGDKVRASLKRYRNANRAKLCEKRAKRRCVKIRSCPKLSQCEKTKISNLFEESQSKSKSDMLNVYHVDHIVPLQGKLPDGKRVLGAHRLSNLQVLMDCDNTSKNNRITYKELSKSKEGVDYIFVPDDYHADPWKYPNIGFDVMESKIELV